MVGAGILLTTLSFTFWPQFFCLYYTSRWQWVITHFDVIEISHMFGSLCTFITSMNCFVIAIANYFFSNCFCHNVTNLRPLTPSFCHRFPGLGVALLSIVLTASITITGVFSSITQQQPQPVAIGVFAKYYFWCFCVLCEVIFELNSFT